jgi:hypothetical protein
MIVTFMKICVVTILRKAIEIKQKNAIKKKYLLFMVLIIKDVNNS